MSETKREKTVCGGWKWKVCATANGQHACMTKLRLGHCIVAHELHPILLSPTTTSFTNILYLQADCTMDRVRNLRRP